MTNGPFLSTASVVVILAAVALLAVASAVMLDQFDRFARRRGMMFLVSLASIWAVALLVIALIRHTI
jgi:NADH:ubiquinone oxidoreductase subunit 6 (subunit J)